MACNSIRGRREVGLQPFQGPYGVYQRQVQAVERLSVGAKRHNLGPDRSPGRGINVIYHAIKRDAMNVFVLIGSKYSWRTRSVDCARTDL